MANINVIANKKLKKSRYSNYTGIYKENILRSYIELLQALELEYITKKAFKTEAIVLHDSLGNKKIPDFVVYSEDGNIEYLIELKNSQKDIDYLIKDYQDRKIDTQGFEVKFQFIAKKAIKDFELRLQKVVGLEFFCKIVREFKDQAKTRIIETSFRGPTHGMFGRKHTEFSKQKMCAALKNHPRQYVPRKKYKTRKPANRIYNVSLETRQKISISVRALNANLSSKERKLKYGSPGERNPGWGKPKTDAQKLAISKKNKGRKFTAEQCLRRSRPGVLNHMYGKKHSDSARANMSAGKQRANHERRLKGESTCLSMGFKGKEHSDKTKAQMSRNAAWGDPDRKLALLKQRFLSYTAKFCGEEKEVFNKYCCDVVSGLIIKRPRFCAKIGAVNMNIILRNFLSIESFIKEMRKIGYVIIKRESNV